MSNEESETALNHQKPKLPCELGGNRCGPVIDRQGDVVIEGTSTMRIAYVRWKFPKSDAKKSDIGNLAFLACI